MIQKSVSKSHALARFVFDELRKRGNLLTPSHRCMASEDLAENWMSFNRVRSVRNDDRILFYGWTSPLNHLSWIRVSLMPPAGRYIFTVVDSAFKIT